MFQSEKFKNFVKTFGPGIMFAGTCIGGSHLVQSTRAGADYGFDLLLIILLANFFKYPFFEFASRYTNATGDSILEGYKKLGNWTLYLYMLITIGSMFIVTAAIASITGGLMSTLVGNFIPNISLNYWIGIILVIVFFLLVSGKFGILDIALKIIGLVLVISVVWATISVLMNGRPEAVVGFEAEEVFSPIGYAFVISLMGWMPTGVDMSSWHSLWTQERIKQTNYHPTLKETLLDFNIGYAITVVLALCFLIVGAYIMYGSGTQFSNSAIGFSNQLIEMFTQSLGDWSYYIIGLAAFSTMFGTCITLIDGYSRAMERTISLLKHNSNHEIFHKTRYISIMGILIVGAFFIVLASSSILNGEGKPIINFKSLVDIATATSFILAPIAGYLNYKIMFNEEVPESHRPPLFLKILAISGLAFLSIFIVIYLWNSFLN